MLITAAILAGGQSRRMGTDKAALEIGGMSLLERTARAALGCELSVLIAGRARPAEWPLDAVLFAEDALPGLGPLGGLATALRQAETSVLALACDLPLLTADALRWLLTCREQAGPHGLVSVNGSQREPLFSIYHLSVLPLIESRLAEGRRSLHGLIEAGEFTFVQTPDWVAAQLVNVNTEEEWGRVGKLTTRG